MIEMDSMPCSAVNDSEGKVYLSKHSRTSQTKKIFTVDAQALENSGNQTSRNLLPKTPPRKD
jgi:hypothetical protein